MRQMRREEFPALVTQIPDPPKALFMRGKLPSPDLKYLCVVGSRACSHYGRRMTQQLIAGLSRYPIAIVSGMALGIDAEALKAAVDVGLPAVAVLPSSVDDESLYPVTNRLLAQNILTSGGLLMSEEKGPYKAMIHDFPKRDRIMAAMAHATLIIEAGEKSGTLITAKFALDYNRRLLAIPHELGRESGLGSNSLLRDGAELVRNSVDILEALDLVPLQNPYQATLPTDLNEIETKTILTLTQPRVKDEIIEASGLSAQDASIALSSLLIRGLITERLGKIERV